MVMKVVVFTGTFLFILAFIGLLFAARVFAQGAPIKRCYPADKLERRMASQFQEEQVSVAPTSGGKLIERWESAAGTWTLLVRVKRNVLCVISSGSNWRELPRGQAVGETS